MYLVGFDAIIEREADRAKVRLGVRCARVRGGGRAADELERVEGHVGTGRVVTVFIVCLVHVQIMFI